MEGRPSTLGVTWVAASLPVTPYNLVLSVRRPGARRFGCPGAESIESLYHCAAMAKIRPIIPPLKEGKHVTLSEARAAFRELKRGPLGRANRKGTPPQKSAAKAG